MTAVLSESVRDARARLDRLDPRIAYDAVRFGAVLVDIRPELNRELEGAIPGAIVIDRSRLEHRLDPASPARLTIANYELHVVVFCNEGYASSLAAASLKDRGVLRATDMDGGYRAWRAAGLPTTNHIGTTSPDNRAATSTGTDGYPR